MKIQVKEFVKKKIEVLVKRIYKSGHQLVPDGCTNRNVPVYLRNIRKKSSDNFHSPKWHSRVSVPIRKPLQRFTALWQRPTQTK